MGPTDGLANTRIPWPWILAAAAALLYIPFIGGVPLFDWDEINFAEISREMITTGDYLNTQVNYQPFFEKPPFFFWLQVVCMKMFGIQEFSARLPNALGGLLVLVFLFKLGTHWINRRFGLFWALSYMGSILPVLYHKSGIIDPWFNLFIFASIAAWIEGTKNNQQTTRWLLVSGLLSGMAVLTKGPVGPLLVGLTVLIFRIATKDKNVLSLRGLLLFILGNTLVAGIWFGINWLSNGPDFIMAFLKYQAQLLTESVAGHKGFPGYHFAVTLFGVFPASLFALAAIRRKTTNEPTPAYHLRLAMLILLVVVLALFSIVQSKIVHYSSLAYYPVSFLSAWAICRFLDGELKWKAWHLTISAFVAGVILIVMIALPFAGQHLDWIKSSFTFDAFTRSAMDADVQWNNMDYFPAIWFLMIIGTFITLWRKSKIEQALLSLFAGTALFVNIVLIFFIVRIEKFSQHAAVEFCQSYTGEQVEIKTLGFKSYLPYFYAQKPVPDAIGSTEEIEHYYILRTDKRKKLAEYPELELLYEKNGFIFLRRE